MPNEAKAAFDGKAGSGEHMVKTMVEASFASIDFSVPPQLQSGAALDSSVTGTAVGTAVGAGGGVVGLGAEVGAAVGAGVAAGAQAETTIETTMSTAMSAHILRLCDMFFSS
jgi:hypothetical protein